MAGPEAVEMVQLSNYLVFAIERISCGTLTEVDIQTGDRSNSPKVAA